MTKYCLEQDESGDFFVIPVDRQDEWIEMMNIPDDISEYPDWAIHIGAYQNIEFENWTQVLRA